MTKLEAEIDKIRGTVDELARIERRIVRAVGRLKGEPGETGLQVAAERIAQTREALEQSEEEIDVFEGLYLDDDDDPIE